MPTEQENIQYLYLVLTHSGNPTMDWDVIGNAMNLKKGAVSKRWSRLKKSMENGETPSGSVYKFLWLCVKHSARDKALDWNDIAEKCGTTAGAASKRYSRMRQAFEAGEGPPGSKSTSPAPKTQPKSTPKKPKTDSVVGEATLTPKRKRVSPKKKTTSANDSMIKSEQEESDNEHIQDIKKSRITKSKTTPKSRASSKTNAEQEIDVYMPTTETNNFIKSEAEDDFQDTFIDAKEWVNDLVSGTFEHEDTDKEQSVRVNEWLNETPTVEM